jgi:crossover junction endodeoxyribonuclease RuvC
MIFLGLDISSVSTGWSILSASNDKDVDLIAFGEIDLSKYKKKSFPLEYILVLYKELNKILLKYSPEHIYMEDIYLKNVSTIKSLGRMRGICELTCIKNGIKNIGILKTSSIRKNVFGKGNMKKEEVCAIMEERFKTKIETPGYDASDAIAVALGGIKEYFNGTK